MLHLREKNASPHTITAYRFDLDEFIRFIRADFPDDKITAHARLVIRAYLDTAHKKFHRSSVVRKVYVLRSFFKFLVRTGALEQDPFRYISTPKMEKRLPSFLTEQEMASVLDVVKDGFSLGARDQALLELLYSCGLRVSELVSMNREDADLFGGMVRVIGKGDKERMVPVGDTALESIYEIKPTGNNQ